MSLLQKLLVIFSLFYCIIIKIKCDPSNPRSASISAVVDSKLYIIGGISRTYLVFRNGTNEVIYLDLTKSFDVSSPLWEDITKTAGSPVVSYESHAALGGKDNSLIFMY